jgi:FkbM family methyltransferase
VDRPGGVAALVNAMGEYDYNNMELLRFALLRGPGVFVDVGANIGSYTLVASEIPNARVMAIEPHPTTFALLKHNAEINFRTNITCLNLALSEKAGWLTLTNYAESSINSVSEDEQTQPLGLRVPSRRLDELCRELAIEPDFMKIDVEGHEEPVLKGLGEFLGKVKMILIERGDDAVLRTLLHEAGYSGPWFFHFNRKQMRKEKQPRQEDPIYVTDEFISVLNSMGITMVSFS